MNLKALETDPIVSQNCAVSIIIGVLGELPSGETFAAYTAQELARASASANGTEIDLIFVFDGPLWSTLPVVQALKHQHPKARFLFNDKPECLPSCLFNLGLPYALGKFVLFSRPTLPINSMVLSTLIDIAKSAPNSEQIHMILSSERLRRCGLPHAPSGQIAHTWLLSTELASIADVVIPTALVRKVGGFDTSPILQQCAEWAMLVRLTSRVPATVQTMQHPITSHNFGFTAIYGRLYPASLDIRQRYIARQPWLDEVVPATAFDEALVLQDLPASERAYHMRQISRFRGDEPRQLRTSFCSSKQPIKVVVIGGLWEYHHNRLCFFNYLDHLAGSSVASYKSLFDCDVKKEYFIGNDIVFISRVKTNRIANILAWCDELEIPTVYMIDDNWFSVADDWPDQYGVIFDKNSPFFRNFMRGITGADYVLTYNKHLAADLSPYNDNILMLPNSIELERFESVPRPASVSRFLIGYSGSRRYTNAPFEALGTVGERRSDVDIILSGSISPEQEKYVRHCNVIRRPSVSYSQYFSDLRRLGVDILLAPLDDTRTSASKCPNKYLEITALGAVGIYSNVDPYRWYIRDGENGFMVSNTDNVEEWCRVIEHSLERSTLARIHAAARADVFDNYSVSVVSAKFMEMINMIIAQGKRKC
ncbi:hypothetical protein IHE33_09675 [Mycetohabitans endofungorum]|uniref:hypothetical protein n=1 Tax=Mycetohabitans endofungorum TaxID=417203 RepID=UPI0030CADE24